MTEISSHWRKAALAAGLCLLLTGCGGGGVEAPAAYVIGENNTATLDSVLTSEEGGEIVAASVPSAEAEEEGKEEEKEEKDGEKTEKDSKKDKKDKKKEEAEEEPTQLSEKVEGEETDDGQEEAASEVCVYTYSGITPEALDRYTDALRAKEEGFRIIDEEFTVQKQRPEYSSAAGSVTFARNAVDEEGVLFEVVLNWSGNACIVTVQCAPGAIVEPVEEESSSGGAAPMMQRTLTLTETIDYVNSLPPSAIGLEGESMDEYTLLPVQGSPMVDGQVCRHLNVYQEDPNAGTNIVKGTYLVGGSGVYQLDEETKEVKLVHSW